MKPDESVAAFAAFADAQGVSVSRCTPRQGVELMFAFYRAVKPQGCVDPDGDMLLYQWGTYDWGAGRHFEVNITRQFREAGLEDDDTLSQLSLTFRFVPMAALEALGAGNRWCDGPTEFDIVKDFALSHPALLAVADDSAGAVELTHFDV